MTDFSDILQALICCMAGSSLLVAGMRRMLSPTRVKAFRRLNKRGH